MLKCDSGLEVAISQIFPQKLATKLPILVSLHKQSHHKVDIFFADKEF